MQMHYAVSISQKKYSWVFSVTERVVSISHYLSPPCCENGCHSSNGYPPSYVFLSSRVTSYEVWFGCVVLCLIRLIERMVDDFNYNEWLWISFFYVYFLRIQTLISYVIIIQLCLIEKFRSHLRRIIRSWNVWQFLGLRGVLISLVCRSQPPKGFPMTTPLLQLL